MSEYNVVKSKTYDHDWNETRPCEALGRALSEFEDVEVDDLDKVFGPKINDVLKDSEEQLCNDVIENGFISMTLRLENYRAVFYRDKMELQVLE